MITTMFQTRFRTAERMRDALVVEGFDVEIVQAEPGRQQVVCTRREEQVLLDVIDPKRYAFADPPREFFPRLSWRAKGYLVAPLRPGWVFQFALEIAWLLQKSKFLLDGPTQPPCSARCPKCGLHLRSESARQCFQCGATWREESE
jgi:hypothetical protein